MVLLLGWLMFPAWTAPRRFANSESDTPDFDRTTREILC
jgi:hypothetical protein